MKYLLRALFGVATTMSINGANASQPLPTQDAELQSKAAWDETVRTGSLKSYAEFSIKHSNDPRAKIAITKLEEGIAVDQGAFAGIQTDEADESNASINDVKNSNSLIYV